MRKIAISSVENNTTPKVMLYEEHAQSVYLFGYDTLFDTRCKFAVRFDNIQEAEESCYMDYHVDSHNWILIADPQEPCQPDLIIPEQKDQIINKELTLKGMTGNERLWFSGLIYEFDQALKKDRKKARKILNALQFDAPSIELILKKK